jgi:hypothetical protein
LAHLDKSELEQDRQLSVPAVAGKKYWRYIIRNKPYELVVCSMICVLPALPHLALSHHQQRYRSRI